MNHLENGKNASKRIEKEFSKFKIKKKKRLVVRKHNIFPLYYDSWGNLKYSSA